MKFNNLAAALVLILASSDSFAKAGLNELIDNVFHGMDPMGKAMLKNELKTAPDEVTKAIADNYRMYRNEKYYKYGPDGKSAVTFTPSPGLNLNKGTVTGVYTTNGRNETHEFSVISRRKPSEVEIPPDDVVYRGFKKDGHNGYAMSPKRSMYNERDEDIVPSVPVNRLYKTGNHEVITLDYYTAMKVGGEDRRFTLGSTLNSAAPGAKPENVSQGVFIEAMVSRESPTAPINKIEGYFKPRGETKEIKFTYDLSNKDNPSRQIQDIKLSDNPTTNEQLMEIVTTDGERMVYVMKKDGDGVKLERKDLKPSEIKADMKEYKARIKHINSRKSSDASGEGAKGLAPVDTER